MPDDAIEFPGAERSRNYREALMRRFCGTDGASYSHKHERNQRNGAQKKRLAQQGHNCNGTD
jgi:hypothetical protein